MKRTPFKILIGLNSLILALSLYGANAFAREGESGDIRQEDRQADRQDDRREDRRNDRNNEIGDDRISDNRVGNSSDGSSNSGRGNSNSGGGSLNSGQGSLNSGRGSLNSGSGSSNSVRGNQITQEITRLRARLSGSAISGLIPSGHADFEKRTDRVKFSVEVEDVNLSLGTELRIFIGTTSTTSVGTLILDNAIEKGGDLNLDSRDGDTVPEVKVGDVIRVVAPNGNIILTGEIKEKVSAVASVQGGGTAISAANRQQRISEIEKKIQSLLELLRKIQEQFSLFLLNR